MSNQSKIEDVISWMLVQLGPNGSGSGSEQALTDLDPNNNSK